MKSKILLGIYWLTNASLACDVDEFPGSLGVFPSQCSFWLYSGFVRGIDGGIPLSVSFERLVLINLYCAEYWFERVEHSWSYSS